MAIETLRGPAIAVRAPEARLLRWALAIDGAGSALNGLAYLVAAGWIGERLGLPTSLLLTAGAVLVVYGAALTVMSARPELSPAAVKAVIAINVLWLVDSVVVAATGWFDPTGTGIAWILIQAALVGGFAVVQGVGLRRAAA